MIRDPEKMKARVFFEATVNDFTVKTVTKRLVPAEAEYAAEQRRNES
jgi:hypothetical protein